MVDHKHKFKWLCPFYSVAGSGLTHVVRAVAVDSSKPRNKLDLAHVPVATTTTFSTLKKFPKIKVIGSDIQYRG